ncbi:MAG TPA: LptA/OstA family protein [Verrucomicrobiae bacterium]|nr:LptA/OstA family protein [Verrucomicrobiae bacterium]
MNARLKFLFIVLALCVVALLAQAPPGARISNFEAPTSDTAGKHSVVKGANAEPVGKGVYKITAPHVDNFGARGVLESTIDAKECFFDPSGSQDVWSDTEFAMKRVDGQMFLKGVGFRWTSRTSQLAVSNKVEALIQRRAVASASTAGGSSNAVHITAQSLRYDADLVTFTGDVRAIDPNGELRARVLKVRLSEKNDLLEIEAIDEVLLTQEDTEARGGRAVYNHVSGLLRLSQNAQWKMGDRFGESDLLILDRTNKTVRAENNVKMSLPSSLVTTNLPGEAARASTNRLNISADTFDYAETNLTTGGRIVIFNGNVHALDPQAELTCELLTLFFDPTNRLVRAVADRDVQIARGDGWIKGTRAVFEKDEITIPNNPTWRLKDNTGAAELLVFNPRTREVRAIKKVRMEIPISGATNLLLSATGTTNTAPPTSSMLIVTADYFTNLNYVATFADNVRASEARGQIDANKIEVHLNSTNRVERVVAEGDVIIIEEKTRAIGQRADYDVTAGLIRLSGNPKVIGEDATAIAKEFVIDLINHKRQPVAPFRIEVRNIKQKKP